MHKKLFYVFLTIWILNIIVNGLMSFINLVILGVFLGIVAGKQKNGTYSLWKLIVGIGIASCNLLVGLGTIFHIIKF